MNVAYVAIIARFWLIFFSQHMLANQQPLMNFLTRFFSREGSGINQHCKKSTHMFYDCLKISTSAF